MNRRGLNAEFLTPEQLDEFGVQDAAQRNILVHRTAVIVDFSKIEFGRNVRIDPNTVISCHRLTIGSYVHLGCSSSLSGGGAISMGDFSCLSHQCMVFSSTDDYSGKSLTNPMVPEKYKNVVTDDVVIGAHAIVGAGTTILPGATLGDGASIGAGSLVKGHLAPWTIHAGSPTRIIRPRLKRCLELEAELRREEAASPERE